MLNDILLASNNLGLLHDTKNFLSCSFAMLDLGEAFVVLGIEIYRDRSRGVLGLSQKAYISKVLERFNMTTCSPSAAPTVKGDKLSKQQSPHNKLSTFPNERCPIFICGWQFDVCKGLYAS